MDTAFQVTRDKSVPGLDVVTLTTVYQKDAEEAAPILFDLVVVEASPNRTSLVPVLRLGKAPKAEALTGPQKAAEDTLRAMQAEAAEPVAEGAWRERCAAGRSVSAGETAKARKEAFRAAYHALVTRGRVIAEDGFVWLAGAPELAAQAEKRRSPLPSASGKAGGFGGGGGESLGDSAPPPPGYIH